MLSSWNIEYEPVDVQGNEAGWMEMKRLGISSLPATVLGGRYTCGWNPQALADLVGAAYGDVPALTPDELMPRLDRILYLTQKMIAAVPTGKLEVEKALRKRSLRDLCYHVFRLSDAFVDTMEQGQLMKDWLDEKAPAGIQSGPGLADFGRRVRGRIEAWKKAASDDIYEKSVSTFYGDQNVHLLLERTAWHAGQHLRQIYDLLTENGITPSIPLKDSVFEGLPMPADLW